MLNHKLNGLILSVFKLVLHIHVMVNWQLSKRGIRWPVSHNCIAGSGIQLMEVTYFKVIRWPVFGFQLIARLGPFLKVPFTLLSAYSKSWITWERHFLKHPSRALLLALAKSMYYLLYTTLDSPLRESFRALNFRSRVPRSPTVWVYVNFVEFMRQGKCSSGIGRPDIVIINANTCRKRNVHIKNNLQSFLSYFGTV